MVHTGARRVSRGEGGGGLNILFRGRNVHQALYVAVQVVKPLIQALALR